MSVHKSITKHAESQHEKVKMFHSLEEERERAIDEAVLLCKKGEPYSVDTINDITKQINELAKTGPTPLRKLVTTEMLEEYVSNLKEREENGQD
ncbi:DUF2533 family protein [Bacillus tianshenii]|nr:DUF2533 family protein [Bacillus tianshenii]